YLESAPSQIVLAGEDDSPGIGPMLHAIYRRYLPKTVILHSQRKESREAFARLNPFINEMSIIGGRTTAYVCRSFVCELPATDPAELDQLLEREQTRQKR
ncbi:MAG TPA: thioredoxin domain-containing protein, partial [Bacteroidota bacterium]|nr:thioredoxin domain-containing protein [Bacteroidota bacterium]